MAGLADQLGARIVILVDAMPEAHQAEGVVTVLGLGDELGDARDITDDVQHVQDRLVCPPMSGAPQAGDARRDAGVGIGPAGPGQAHGGGRGILLMVGVQDEDALQGLHQHGIGFIIIAGRGVHHAEKILHVAELVVRVHERHARAVLVTHRDDGGNLGNEPDRAQFAFLLRPDVQGIVIEGGERGDHADHDRHGMGVAPEAVEEIDDLFMHHGVHGDVVGKGFELLRRRQLAVHDEVADLQKPAILGELFDGITPIQQDALVAVDVGDRGTATGRGVEARVIGKHPGLLVERLHVDDARPG